MIHPELVKQAEAVSIVDYLASKGIEPIRATGHELLYSSPLRENASPSFYVNPFKNRFKDFGSDQHRGNVFRLVQLLENCNFPVAVAKLLEFSGKPVENYANLFLSATEIPKPIEQKVIITKPVRNPVLINYLLSRGIPYSVGKKYLCEIMKSVKDRIYFHIGFENDSNGYALRNKYNKSCHGTQDITTFDFPERGAVAVFEGFFDFLSAMVYFGLDEPEMAIVVLNSTANRRKATEYLRQFEQINCYFDRDKGGQDCFRLMRDVDGLPVIDRSALYDGYNDFNAFIIGRLPR